VALAKSLKLNVGAGYRATNADRGFSPLLRGATGSVSVAFELK